MGNTISQPIINGIDAIKNPRMERAIRFLEDPNNIDKPIPSDLLLGDEKIYLTRHGRSKCAQFLRRSLQGGTIG